MGPIPLHIVAGFLGAGKTTLLRRQLALRAESERCAVVVNDFGEAAFDATLLDGSAGLINIPGGCVCCTAPEGLVPALRELMEKIAPDRIFIEPTGLARPCDILDTLSRSPLAPKLELAPVMVVVDPARLLSSPQPPLLLEQVDGADLLVANRVDRASPEAMAAFRRLAGSLWPPPLGVYEITRGELSPKTFDLRREAAPPGEGADRDHDHAHAHGGDSTEGWSAASRSWPSSVVFDLHALTRLLEDPALERVKGIFHTDLGWYSVERASGEVSSALSLHRSLSRVDVILEGTPADAQAILDHIHRARWSPPLSDAPTVRLKDSAGTEVELTRYALAAIPGQIPDVSALVPGRVGQGVFLREVLRLVAPPPDARFIIGASDGMTSAPVPVSGAGDAVLVHSFEGGALPEGQGGPYRLLVPPGEGRSACANVKKVDRIQLLVYRQG